MPYSSKSLSFAWLIILALFVASASGVAQDRWLVLLIAVAFVVPALVLRSPVHVAAALERSSIPAKERKRSPLDPDRVMRAIEHTRRLPA
jgi:hypothetical protein